MDHVMMWTELTWLRTRPMAGYLERKKERSDP
jgi:hypothetical protein